MIIVDERTGERSTISDPGTIGPLSHIPDEERAMSAFGICFAVLVAMVMVVAVGVAWGKADGTIPYELEEGTILYAIQEDAEALQDGMALLRDLADRGRCTEEADVFIDLMPELVGSLEANIEQLVAIVSVPGTSPEVRAIVEDIEASGSGTAAALKRAVDLYGVLCSGRTA